MRIEDLTFHKAFELNKKHCKNHSCEGCPMTDLKGDICHLILMFGVDDETEIQKEYLEQEIEIDMGPVETLPIPGETEEELRNNLSGKNEDCSFKVLFEATKYGFWYKVKYLNKYIHLVPDEKHAIVYSWNDGYPILQYMEITNDIYYTAQCVYDVFFTDYKKTFWLKEDRSE